EEVAAHGQREHDHDRVQPDGGAGDARAGDRAVDELDDGKDDPRLEQRAEEAAAEEGDDDDRYDGGDQPEVRNQVEHARDRAYQPGERKADDQQTAPGQDADDRGGENLATQEARKQCVIVTGELDDARTS